MHYFINTQLLWIVNMQDSSEGYIAFMVSELLPHYSQISNRDRDTIAIAQTAVLHHSSSEAASGLWPVNRAWRECCWGSPVLRKGWSRLDPVRAPDQTGARLWHTDSRGGAEQVALSLLHKLLTEPDAGASMMSGPVGHTVRSTLAGAKSHFLLTLAHYTYFHHRPEL